MNSLTKCVVLGAVCVVAVTGSSLFAADKAEQKKAGRAIGFQLPASIQLTEEQSAKIAAIRKEHGPEFQNVMQQVNAVYTRDQRRARREAMAEARQDDLKGPALRKAVEAAVTLTEEQKSQLEPLLAKQKELQANLRSEIVSVLTDEQKAELPKPKKAKGKKGRKKKAAE